jgi:hypothetical protein
MPMKLRSTPVLVRCKHCDFSAGCDVVGIDEAFFDDEIKWCG